MNAENALNAYYTLKITVLSNNEGARVYPAYLGWEIVSIKQVLSLVNSWIEIMLTLSYDFSIVYLLRIYIN